ALDGRDGLVGDAARDDELEEVEIGGDVEGETVGGDSAGDVDADGGNFGLRVGGGPDAGESGDAGAGDAEVSAGADEHFFEAADVFDDADFGSEGAEIEDGVADELSGAVEGDVAAAITFDQLDALLREEVGRGDDVFLFRIAAEGDDGGVFEKEEGVVNDAALA